MNRKIRSCTVAFVGRDGRGDVDRHKARSLPQPFFEIHPREGPGRARPTDPSVDAHQARTSSA
ncbi:MAG TPA: hypothetical protein VGN34_00510 [Ktedonobacteraceae bacterium]